MKEGFRRILRTAMFFLVVPAGALETEARPRGSVAIEKRTETLRREDGQEAVIRFPVFGTNGDVELARKIQRAAGLEAGTERSLEEWKKDFEESWWLDEIDYQVRYNKNFILSITYSLSGTGAYPHTSTTRLAIDLRRGERLAPADLFKSTALKDLAVRLEKALKAEVAETLRSHAARPDAEELDLETLRADLGEASFTVEALGSFLVDDRGVTFFYDYGFPHVSEALEPPGEYFLSYAELKPYIEKSGPLGVFVR